MAKYRLHIKRFIGGFLYDPGDPRYKDHPPEIEVPDDFPAGMGMEPLDPAAKKAVAEYEKRVGKQPPEPPIVVKEITSRPPIIEEPPEKPLGDFKKGPDLMPPVKAVPGKPVVNP